MSSSVRSLCRVTTTVAAGATAAVLLLTGCGGSGAVSGASSGAATSSSSSASPSESAAPAESASASAQPSESATPSESASASAPASGQAGAAGGLTDEAAASVVSKLKMPNGEKLTSLPASKVRQAAGATNEVAKSATVTPAACKALSLKASSVPKDAAVGAGSAPRSKVVVSLILSENTAELRSRVTGARDLLTRCAKVTLKAEGSVVQQTLSAVPVAKVGEDSVAVLNVQRTSGVTVEMTQLSAVKGKRLTSITAVGKPADAGDLASLAQLATKALDTPATGGTATA